MHPIPTSERPSPAIAASASSPAPADAGQGVGTLGALDQMPVVRLSVGLTSALIAQIKAIAAVEERSQGAVARMLIAEALRSRTDQGNQA